MNSNSFDANELDGGLRSGVGCLEAPTNGIYIVLGEINLLLANLKRNNLSGNSGNSSGSGMNSKYHQHHYYHVCLLYIWLELRFMRNSIRHVPILCCRAPLCQNLLFHCVGAVAQLVEC